MNTWSFHKMPYSLNGYEMSSKCSTHVVMCGWLECHLLTVTILPGPGSVTVRGEACTAKCKHMALSKQTFDLFINSKISFLATLFLPYPQV